ncbi:hypothetical protein, partial [Thermobifida halotolerans]
LDPDTPHRQRTELTSQLEYHIRNHHYYARAQAEALGTTHTPHIRPALPDLRALLPKQRLQAID